MSFSTVFSKIGADVAKILPFVQTTVVNIEDLFDGVANSGTAKKQAAMNAITAAISALGIVLPGATVIGAGIENTVSVLIDAVVAFNNSIGLFKKSTPVVSGAPAPTPTPGS